MHGRSSPGTVFAELFSVVYACQVHSREIAPCWHVGSGDEQGSDERGSTEEMG
jgi:hypothetical protein